MFPTVSNEWTFNTPGIDFSIMYRVFHHSQRTNEGHNTISCLNFCRHIIYFLHHSYFIKVLLTPFNGSERKEIITQATIYITSCSLLHY